MAAVMVAWAGLWAFGALPGWMGWMGLAPLVVALVGWIDDHRPLSAGLRLSVHLAAGLWMVAWVPAVPEAGWLAAAVLAVAWTVNLYNFMDGIDGLAAAEAVFVFAAVGWLLPDCAAGLQVLAWSVAAASAGFLFYNRPPARIFLGDVGSGFLGAAVAVLALAGQAVGLPLWVWLVLGAVFWVDATYTLIVRGASGQRVWEAHRSHAYQILARRWGSHSRVLFLVLAYDLGWLLPVTVWALRAPDRWPWALALGAAPVLVLCAGLGAGRAPARHSEAA